MSSGNKAPFHRFDPGINGKQYEETHEDILGKIERIEKSWPEDSFGAKLSLGANYGYLLDNMGQGDIDMMTNGEPIDPPRDDPAPGSYEFGARARARRERLRRRRREEFRPEDPEDALFTDISSGKKTSLKKRRQALEDAGNF